MKRPDKIDLFDLSDKVLDKLNCGGKFKLSHYDFSLKFRRDINYPGDKFNIDLVLFGEEITHSYYSNTYFSVEQIFLLFFVHLSDDYGYEEMEYAIISTKRKSLSNKLKETISELEAIIKQRNVEKCYVFIDEKEPNEFDEKGLPIFQLNIISEQNEIDLKIELSWTSCDFSDKKGILELMNKKIDSLNAC